MKLEDSILSDQIMINNALNNPDIISALSIFGYDKTRIQEGKKLLEDTLEYVNKQKVEYSEQYEATSELNKAFEEAKKAYSKTLKVARVAYRDDVKAQAALMLNGIRKKSYSGWLLQAESFYKNIGDITTAGTGIYRFGYTAAKLGEEKALVDKVKDALYSQKKETGEAQKATEERDAKLDSLDEWLSDFKEIAEAALADDPQLLEKLGIKK